MEQTARLGTGTLLEEPQSREHSSPAYQAYRILQVAFVIAPIAAGLDKFTHLLVDWDRYLAPVVARVLPFSGHTFMLIAGVIEVAAGVGVAVKPRIFAPVVGLWLLGIVLNLLLTPGYLDVALRDVGLSLGAFALWRLSLAYDRS